MVMKGLKRRMIRIYEGVKGNMWYGIDKAWILLHPRGSEHRKTIAVYGAPRTGTTLLMEVMETLKGYKSIFEPFHTKWYREYKKIGLWDHQRPYIDPHESNPMLNRYLDKVFKGLVAGLFPNYRLCTLHKRLYSKNILVKFVRANRLIPYIVRNFNLRANFLILRHPCATISSQLSRNWIPDKKYLVLREKQTLEKLGLDDDAIGKLLNIDRPEELLALQLALDYLIPLSKTPPNKYYLVFYEDLILNPEKELKRVFSKIGERVPSKALRIIRKPSIAASKDLYLEVEEQLNKWKKKLSRKQVDNILRVFHLLGIHIYGDDALPYKDEVKLIILS